MVSMEQINQLAEEGFSALDELLLPIDSALGSWPEVKLSPDGTFYLRQGQPVLVPNAPTEGMVRLYDADGIFMGAGEILDDGKVAPRRMM